MPSFSNAKYFTIRDSQFMETTINMSGPTGIDVLREASCPEAAHDSSARSYPPRCFPGTRKQYTEDIIQWAVPALGNTTPIYWMKGPAGVGKSAIAQTCAEELMDMKKLGAAFFFSFNGRNKPEEFFPSIAYQLSTFHPPYHDLIGDKIRRDKTLVNKSMSSQFRYLIDEPLREVASQGKGIGKRTAVIIDGLDECDGADAQCEIIRVIASAASDDTLPLCWAFFSRPEPHIEATFASAAIAPHCHKVTLPISRDVDKEIELYLRNGFENILRRYNASQESQWPTADDIKIVVDAAGGSFIYATTVIRFVDRPGSSRPQNRLRKVIDVILDRRKRDPRAGTSDDKPFAELDTFYTLILQRIPRGVFPSVHLLLALLCLRGSLGAILAANILGLSEDELRSICNQASAVVQFRDPAQLELDPTIDTSRVYTQVDRDVLAKLVVQINRDLGGRVSIYHKSFNDFLLDPARSGEYCVKASEALAKCYLRVHHNCDRSYCWEGSDLVLAPGVTSYALSLTWPYTNELVNSLIKARVYIDVGREDPQIFSAPGGLGVLSADLDFRKRLHIFTQLGNATGLLSGRGLLWGSARHAKSYPGTRIVGISLNKFDVKEFKLMIKKCQRANIIQRYYPSFISRIKFLLRGEPRGRFESALYRMGRGNKSIFWYWEIDYKRRYYREFRTIDLLEGEKRFREEDFASWPKWRT